MHLFRAMTLRRALSILALLGGLCVLTPAVTTILIGQTTASQVPSGPSAAVTITPASALNGAGQLTGLITRYNGVTTAGSGVTPVWATTSVTAQVAAITTTTLLATGTAPGAGLYTINAYVNSTVTCGTPGPAVVGITLTWTDETGTKSAQTMPLFVSGAATPLTTLVLGTTTGFAWGTANVFAAASTNIQFATTYTACTAGTGTYALRIGLEQLF